MTLESLTTGYFSDESEGVATVVQSDTQRLLGSKCADPHPPGFRALINCMDKFSGRTGDNDYEALVDDFQEATTYCDSDDKQRVHGSPGF